MARPQTPPIFAQMRHARSCLEQVAALRALKNDITGHIQKKERWVEHGILDHIVRLLQVSRSSQGQNGKDIQGGSESRSKDLSDQEQVRLQALQLLSIFAKGKLHMLLSSLLQLKICCRWTFVSQTPPRDRRSFGHLNEYLPSRQP